MGYGNPDNNLDWNCAYLHYGRNWVLVIPMYIYLQTQPTGLISCGGTERCETSLLLPLTFESQIQHVLYSSRQLKYLWETEDWQALFPCARLMTFSIIYFVFTELQDRNKLSVVCITGMQHSCQTNKYRSWEQKTSVTVGYLEHYPQIFKLGPRVLRIQAWHHNIQFLKRWRRSSK
jgi:hypothetical protein